ncbi:MAG: hypothetical protein AB7S68_09455 [Polyangiaceae bacterium]
MAAFRSGARIPDIIRGDPELSEMYPQDLMWLFMECFEVRLGDVIALDGWWPYDGPSEVTDELLDSSIRRAIERRAIETLEGSSEG